MPSKISKLLDLHKLGKLTLDEKLQVLEHYGITFKRRELARALADLIADKAKLGKTIGFDAALEAATEADVRAAIGKVLDRYLKESEARFAVELAQDATREAMVAKHGERMGVRLARRMKYRWLTTGGKNVCPQCVDRHGREEVMKVWQSMGIPRAGATYCGSSCQCSLVATIAPALPSSVPDVA